MGLIGKLKDILFEEEEIEEIKIPVEKPVEKKVELPRENKEVKEPVKEDVKTTPFMEQMETLEPVAKPSVKDDYVSERELFKSEESSPFLDFDEEEFSSLLVRPKNKPANVLDYERKKRIEKRSDYGRYEKGETKEVTEKKKFKPSPIISPVYGILNEDYRIEDIKNKNETEDLTIESVRKKAFEPEEKTPVPEEKAEYFEEETVTVKYEEPEEKRQKVKTIDDLLEDTSDEIIAVADSETEAKSIEYDRTPAALEEEKEDTFEKELVRDETVAQETEDLKPVEDAKEEDEDTIESDLFDLIDSMYDNREDGE